MWATSKNNMVIIEYLFPSPYLTFIFLISLKKTTLGRHNRSALYWRNIIVQQTEKKTMRLTSVYEHLFIFFWKTLQRLGLKLSLTKVNNTNNMFSAMLSSSKPTSPTVYEQCPSRSYNKYSWVFLFFFKGQSFKWVPGTFFWHSRASQVQSKQPKKASLSLSALQGESSLQTRGLVLSVASAGAPAGGGRRGLTTTKSGKVRVIHGNNRVRLIFNIIQYLIPFITDLRCVSFLDIFGYIYL